MPRQAFNSARYHVPVPGFTQAVLAPANGRILYLSGLTARTADGTIVAEGDVEGQTRQILEQMRNILEDAGGSLDDVVKITTYLRDAANHRAVHDVRRLYFGDTPPASTTVQIGGLFDARQLIEMDAVAVLAPETGCPLPGVVDND